MLEFVLPPLVAVLAWWLGTGVVMWLDGRPRDTHRWSVATSTLIAVGALVCVAKSANNASAAGAYAGFSGAVLVWGWHELTFLTGWLTGPRKRACSAPLREGVRFGQAVQVILWHELALLAMLAAIVVLTWSGSNPVAAWTFGLLWMMRLSAKLNLFLGVRNLGEEFLPAHLQYLGSYFRQRRMNALLPLSVLGGSAVALWLVLHALDSSGGARAGALLVASMLLLAVAEHLLLVLPLPSTALWRWALRESSIAAP
jgi:putative photosynthetic complex assembly protein 2